MSRVDELEKKYPSFPRHMIARCDTAVHGLRDTGKLDEVGRWVRMAGLASYATYDFDITLKEWVAAHPGRQQEGHILRPGHFVLPETGLQISPNVNTKSDLEIRAEGSGKYALYQGDERVHEVLHQPVKDEHAKVTGTGAPTINFIGANRKTCFMIVPVRHCEYFPLGVACKFCNFNATQDDAASVGIGRLITTNVEQTLEAYKLHAAEAQIVEGRFELGGFTKSENEARIHAAFIEKMANATPNKPNFMIHTQPMDKKNMERLKDVGLNSMSFQMEIWDPELFAEAVPGKAQYTGRDRYLEAYQEALDVLGPGNVGCVLVGGLGMIPEKGHKTWQESRDSMIEGIDWMTKRGIYTFVTTLRLPPGSTYASEENRRKFPPTEYYLELTQEQHRLSKEYGFWDKFNKLMWCGLDCFNDPIQLAAIELAGGLGEWMAPVVPREANWHFDWAEERKALVGAR